MIAKKSLAFRLSADIMNCIILNSSHDLIKCNLTNPVVNPPHTRRMCVIEIYIARAIEEPPFRTDNILCVIDHVIVLTYLVCLFAWTLAAAAACRELAPAARLPRYCLRPRRRIPGNNTSVNTVATLPSKHYQPIYVFTAESPTVPLSTHIDCDIYYSVLGSHPNKDYVYVTSFRVFGSRTCRLSSRYFHSPL